MQGKMGVSVKNENYKFRTDIRDQYLRAKVPIFFKQWAEYRRKEQGERSKEERGMRCR
jgi:protein gp37